MKVRFGIIGAGRIAERFASVARSSERAEVVAVASRDEARAADFASRMGIARRCPSYLDLVRDPEIDAVYVATTHNFHLEQAALCLENGKAVLVEKPLVTARADAEALASLSKSRKLLLMEAMWTRCIPAFRKAREWVREGRIGAPRLVEAAFCFKAPFDPKDRLFNPELAGGALFDAGVYPIEFATGILGENPSRVSGVASIGETGVDYFDSIGLGFPSGAVASLACGLTAQVPRDARVYGDEGSVAVYDFLGARKCERFDRDGKPVEAFESKFEDGFIFEIEHFAELLRKGAIESDLIPQADSVACAGVFDELRKGWVVLRSM
jgi:predicted dehydrogenase